MTERGATTVAAGESIPGWTGGTAVACKVSGAMTGGAMAIVELFSPPWTGSPTHVHSREDEALYVLEGEYEVVLVDTETRIIAGPGATVFLPRGTAHAFRNVGPEPARLLAVVTPAGLEGFFEEVNANPADAAAIAGRYGLRFSG